MEPPYDTTSTVQHSPCYELKIPSRNKDEDEWN